MKICYWGAGPEDTPPYPEEKKGGKKWKRNGLIPGGGSGKSSEHHAPGPQCWQPGVFLFLFPVDFCSQKFYTANNEKNAFGRIIIEIKIC